VARRRRRIILGLRHVCAELRAARVRRACPGQRRNSGQGNVLRCAEIACLLASRCRLDVPCCWGNAGYAARTRDGPWRSSFWGCRDAMRCTIDGARCIDSFHFSPWWRGRAQAVWVRGVTGGVWISSLSIGNLHAPGWVVNGRSVVAQGVVCGGGSVGRSLRVRAGARARMHGVLRVDGPARAMVLAVLRRAVVGCSSSRWRAAGTDVDGCRASVLVAAVHYRYTTLHYIRLHARYPQRKPLCTPFPLAK
jgi:hypothetical protein